MSRAPEAPQLNARVRASRGPGVVALPGEPAARRARRHLHLLTLLTFALSMVATAIAYVANDRVAQSVAQQRFRRLTEHAVTEIARRANLPAFGLRGARAMFAATDTVRRADLGAYVASRDITHEFPGILGLGFIEHVQRPDVERFIAGERSDGAADFTIRPFAQTGSEAPDLYVITSLFADGPSKFMWGSDLGSEPLRRAAIERAIHTGNATVTAPIELRSSTPGGTGYLYFLPVYRNGTHPTTEAERDAALSGVLYTPVALAPALTGISDAADGMVDFDITDAGTPSAAMLFASMPADAADTADRVAHAEAAHLTMSSRIGVGGRTWTVRSFATPRFLATIDRDNGHTAAVGGTVIALLLSALVWAAGRSRYKAVSLATGMTADLTAATDLAVRRSRELDASAALLRRTGEMAHIGGWDLDLARQHLRWTDEVYRIHELEVGTPISLERAVGFYTADAQQQISEAIERSKATGKGWDLELPLTTAKGRLIWVRAQGECVFDGARVVRLCGAFQDITDRRLAEEQLRRVATHDRLTGLPNRALLTDRLQQRLSRARREQSKTFAVLFMDFDRFKLTNDTLGHEAGDELLKQIAERLRSCLRSVDSIGIGSAHDDDDQSVVGRLGGDEFVVLLDELAAPGDAGIVAARVLETLAAPYHILGHTVVSTASIGVVTADARYARPDEMLRDADIAMYEAKAAGRGRFVVFDAQMYERIQQRVAIESELRGAIARDELFLTYQPIVSLNTGRIEGVEALLRWQHPTRGTVTPDVIIPIAEDGGLILPIGDWVIRTACMQFADWQRTLGELAPARINVNLSRKQLALVDLPARVAAILAECEMRPECLHLEVTESAVMADPTMAMTLLEQLRTIGVKIAMDDFGTGHSSLATLHQFPIDVLKVDRNFVKNLSRGREFAAIVQAIAQLARNLGVAVIAEGVESPEQVAMLQTLDCDQAQGYLFGRPANAEEAVAMFRNDRLALAA